MKVDKRDHGTARLPTIRDVAQRAQVSPMSVSNFLNQRFHLMGKDTRRRIETAIAALRYRPRSQARAFRVRKDFSVGMIVIDPSPNFLVEPFIGHVVSGLSTELASKGYACLLQGLLNCNEDEEVIQNFARSDALCIFGAGTDRERLGFLRKLATLGGPMVAIEEQQPIAGVDMAIVRQDDAGGARAIVEHLLQLGARKFVYIGPEPVWAANAARERSIRDVLRAQGRNARLQKLTCGFGNFDDVCRTVDAWLRDGGSCDAMIANNDHIGIAVLKALAARGIVVPRDMMVTGFNRFEFWNYSTPRLTTVSSAAHEMGRIAARALLERLTTGRFSQTEWVLPLALQIGETTRPAGVSYAVGA